MKIKKLSLYLESTMYNYYFDTNRDGHGDTVRLFKAIGDGKYEGYTSEYATVEIQGAPEPKQSNMLSLIEKYGIIMLDFDPEAARLAQLYVRHGVIPEKYRFDALHIAIASINRVDCVLSFNYEHINKLKTKRMVERINLSEGYEEIAICTPMEVLD